MSLRRAYSLVDTVIVVLILGILASIAVPRMFGVTKQAAEADLRQQLAIVRNAIDRFAADNNGVYPAQDKKDTTFKTEIAPYIGSGGFPENPFDDGIKSALVKVHSDGAPLAGQVAGPCGWLYDNQTGEFIANTATLSSDGITRYCAF